MTTEESSSSSAGTGGGGGGDHGVDDNNNNDISIMPTTTPSSPEQGTKMSLFEGLHMVGEVDRTPVVSNRASAHNATLDCSSNHSNQSGAEHYDQHQHHHRPPQAPFVMTAESSLTENNSTTASTTSVLAEAPVTDKLLGLLEHSKAEEEEDASPPHPLSMPDHEMTVTEAAVVVAEVAEEDEKEADAAAAAEVVPSPPVDHPDDDDDDDEEEQGGEAVPPSSVAEIPSKKETETPAVAASPPPQSSWFGGWFGGPPAPAPAPAPIPSVKKDAPAPPAAADFPSVQDPSPPPPTDDDDDYEQTGNNNIINNDADADDSGGAAFVQAALEEQQEPGQPQEETSDDDDVDDALSPNENGEKKAAPPLENSNGNDHNDDGTAVLDDEEVQADGPCPEMEDDADVAKPLAVSGDHDDDTKNNQAVPTTVEMIVPANDDYDDDDDQAEEEDSKPAAVVIEHHVDEESDTIRPPEPTLPPPPPDTPGEQVVAETPPAADAASATTAEQEEEEEDKPSRKEMNEQDKKHLEDAFRASETTAQAERKSEADAAAATATAAAKRSDTNESNSISNESLPAAHHHRPARGPGVVHDDTPIPNADVALRLLRNFSFKTRPKITVNYGGSKSRGIIGYFFGTARDDPLFVPYRDLLDILYDDGEDRELKDESEASHIVDGVMGESGDTMARAKQAIAAFVYVVSQWGHASTHFAETHDTKAQQAFSDLMVAAMDSSALLSAHGCLDDVMISVSDSEYVSATHLIAQSIFSADLVQKRNELAAMKFLLGTGCRVAPSGAALLRGSHLLQTIRTFYHIFLTTESSANKTTARAALQQLVTSVFARMARTDNEGQFKATKDKFPSENHRDAFLVLRSICKLSMRTLPDMNSGSFNHVGLQSSASHDTWDATRQQQQDNSERSKSNPTSPSATSAGMDEAGSQKMHAQLIYTANMHPALESKILALELILYVLQHTDFSRGFIQRSGPQFHAAIRSYLCVSLLKNCTTDNTRVVNLSLRIFVPLVRNFRTILKNEIEAFVTNVFFVILDSKNSPAEHKGIVVKTFDEICSDPATLAEIFLNYDCDLSAVDLFHRIVNALSKVSRTGLQEPKSSGISFMGGASAARMEKFRIEARGLRLDAMRALRQVLASLNASIVVQMSVKERQLELVAAAAAKAASAESSGNISIDEAGSTDSANVSIDNGTHNLVEMYGSKKKRRAEESEAVLRFNQKPSAGIVYAGKCGHIDVSDPVDVARYLLKNKDSFEKTQIGEYLGREAEYQHGFPLKVLHEYVRLLDFEGLMFDDAIRFFLGGFRLPGEAQKIDRIMEKFAERFTEQNPDVFPTADVAFILAFSIIMLNTDLHNPAIKEDRRMTKDSFVRNNRGICDGQDLPQELLMSIFDRIKQNPISLKEDDEARERFAGESKSTSTTGLQNALSPASFFSSHYDEMDRARESNFQKERDHIVRTTESLLKRRRHSVSEHHKTPSKRNLNAKSTPRHPSKFVRTEDSGLRDEYVGPMFEVTWGPALAAFSTAMESANGTIGALLSIATDEELETAAENAAETIEVCLTGFRFAICTAGLCGNDIARDSYMLALSRFSQLGTGVLLEPRHIRCIQTMLSLAREDGELLGTSWQHVFRALSEINRFHQLFHLMARNDRAAAAAAQRRRKALEEKEARRAARERRRAAAEDGEFLGEDETSSLEYASEVDSLAESDLFSDEEDFGFEDNMDAKAIDESNARLVYEGASEAAIEAIYERSSSLSAPAVKEFVEQLCNVSRMEISVGGGSSELDLNQVTYRSQHALLSGAGADQFHHHQPNIYNLQKLVEVAHYNMDSRPRMIFADLWSTIANHLTGTALNANPALAMYAVDSFRQLSIQYIRRDELEVFEFQRRFLKPLETVMARSHQTSTKELLLNCIDRIIKVFEPDASEPAAKPAKPKGGLRSGWVPILAILGLAGQDASRTIAETSFKIFTAELRHCMKDKTGSDVLLNEHFVETVNALLMFASGPHEDICAQAIAKCSQLADFLADDSIEPPQLRRRATTTAPSPSVGGGSRDLELWWPILLGLSRSVGDLRVELRSRALETLVVIINRHFFPSNPENLSSEQYDDTVQTLQLIFRGILTPLLEFAEIGAEEGHTPGLPEDFERFLTLQTSPKTNANEAVEEEAYTGWLETTFDLFLDICVNICQRSIRVFQTDLLVEEVFAILNSCLLSDSGALAVRGIRRLEQFVTSDLDDSIITDDVWATVSHMLRRCLAVRGLPSNPDQNGDNHLSEAQLKEQQEEYAQDIREFIAEDKMLGERRYIGSNAVFVIGIFLTSDRFADSLGFRWRLFLIAGLGRAIVSWEHAALILAPSAKPKRADETVERPPDYRETSMYGRKWMNRFLLQLAAMREVVQAPSDADPKTNRFAAAQNLVTDETERLFACFLELERAASQYRHTEQDEILHKRSTTLVNELLKGYINMGMGHLQDMAWLNPILLSSCIQSKNEDIRFSVQKLVQLTSPSSPTSPAAPRPPPPVNDNGDSASGHLEEHVNTSEEGEPAVREVGPLELVDSEHSVVEVVEESELPGEEFEIEQQAEEHVESEQQPGEVVESEESEQHTGTTDEELEDVPGPPTEVEDTHEEAATSPTENAVTEDDEEAPAEVADEEEDLR